MPTWKGHGGRQWERQYNVVKCKACGQPTREFLVTYGGEKRFLFWKYPDAREIALCREHLSEGIYMTVEV